MAYVGYGSSQPAYGFINASNNNPGGGGSTSVDRPGASLDPGGNVGSPPPGYINPTSDIQRLQGLQNWWDIANAPAQQLATNQVNALEWQKGLSGASSDLQSQAAQSSANFGIQGIGLSREELGVQQGALARQMGLLPQQYGILQNQYGLQERQSWQGAAEQQRSQKGAEVTSGIGGGEAPAQQRKDIQQHLSNALESIGYQRQQSALSFEEQKAQQQDSSKMLGIQSKRLGLNEDEIKSRLQNSLNQIGIGNQISVTQLLAEQYKIQQGQASQLSQFLGLLYQYGGLTVPPAQ
jgi:hypothetical protein